MKMLVRLGQDARASVGAEFALVLPIFLLFVLGIVDVGRMMWTWNRAEKAAQMGVRYAAVTDMADTGLADHDYYSPGVTQRGDRILDDTFGATCTEEGCTCKSGGTCPGIGTFDDTAFDNTVARMQAIMPEIQPANVTIDYS